MKFCYVPKRFHGATAQLIGSVNSVVEQYVAQGYRLTLRQLFYRLVAANKIANTVREYKNLGRVVVDARRAGLVDWDAIEDRTRNLRDIRHWDGPKDAVNWLAEQYHRDFWEDQWNRVEVWIEKEALAGVFQRVCAELRVPFFCCRGYNSESEMYEAATRYAFHDANGHGETMLLHFGDHDPSGIDMTSDIFRRFEVFYSNVHVRRVALEMKQVEKYRLPPNPARETDSRYAGYRKKFGDHSWELDALEPQVLADLVRREVAKIRDESEWKKSVAREKRDRNKLARAAKKWRR